MRAAALRLRGADLIPRVETAAGPLARMVGLLGRSGLPPGSALLLAPAAMIHTCGMRFPLDLIFVDRHWTVTRVARGVRPFRIVGGGRGGWAVLELQAGWLPPDAVRVGDRLEPLE